MDKIKEVKKILEIACAFGQHSPKEVYSAIKDESIEDYAQQICQLFKPKPCDHIFSFQTGLCQCGESLRDYLKELKPNETTSYMSVSNHQQEINMPSTAQGIVNEPDESGLLTDEKQKEYLHLHKYQVGDEFTGLHTIEEADWDIDGLLKAQRDLTAKLVAREIFEEIENSTILSASVRDDVLEARHKDWQALKKKRGVE